MKKQIQFVAIALITISFLTSCETIVFKQGSVPDVVAYSAKTQDKVLAEMQSCPAPTTIELLKDYHVMRNQARFLKGEKVNLPK